MRSRRSLFFLLSFLCASTTGFAAVSETPALLKDAEKALDRSDRKKADFYIARWMGLCRKEAAACDETALAPLLKKRNLGPRAFLPGEWDPGFLDWFEKGIRARWGVAEDRVRAGARSFEIAQATYDQRFFVTVVAYPELELWHVLEKGIVSRPLLLPMGSYRDRPTLFFGKLLKGSSVQSRPFFLDTKKRSLHYVWKPEFVDADGDGTVELWLRFNLAWGNGFLQVLDVYRIRDEKDLVLIRRFEAVNGYARRAPDGTVEVVQTPRFAAQNQESQTWVYKEGAFLQTGSEQVPSVLSSPDWRSVYLE